MTLIPQELQHPRLYHILVFAAFQDMFIFSDRIHNKDILKFSHLTDTRGSLDRFSRDWLGKNWIGRILKQGDGRLG
jgi:hypothetical protein